MKPRSGVERMFIGYAEELPPPREAVAKWAYRHCFEPVAYYWQHRGHNQEIWCQCCGHREPCDGWLAMSVTKYVCPECGARCNVVDRKGAVPTHSSYVSTVEVFKGVQVIRTFEVTRSNYNDGGKTRYGISEIYQIWLLESGREIITTRGCDRSFNYLHWHYGVPYSIGRHNGGCSGYYEYEDTYDIGFNYIYPRSRFTPFFKQRGMTERLVRYLSEHEASIANAFRYMAKTPKMETLVKTGFWPMFRHMVKKEMYGLEKFWKPLNICHRNGYVIANPDLWCDYIDNLIELELDIHNPKYVCPDDLTGQHSIMSARVTRKRQQEKLRGQIEPARKDEKSFRENRCKFFGLFFQGKDISVVALKSVEEFAKEGSVLHHCVFANRYYDRKDSLILSARSNKDHKPVETIEIDLKSFRILQSRGNCNQDSPFHEEILSLVNDNMGEIRKICSNTK